MRPPRNIQKVVGPRGDPGRKGQPWQWPAGCPFWSDPVRRRPPVALGAPSRAATLSSTVQPSRQAWGDPVLRRPAVQLGVTLPSAGRKSYTTAAFFSPVSVRLTRSPPLREGEKKNHTKPRRRRPNRLRVTLTLFAGRLVRRPPAPRRDQTLHQRPGTDLLRPHHVWRVRLPTGAHGYR